MCGIFCMILRPTTKERDYGRIRALISALALHSADRGTDATGLALVQDGDQVKMVKEAKSSYEMVRKKSWRETLEMLGPNTRYVLGHTRKATRGGNESRNAHPFQFEYSGGTLVGVHNGTVTNSEKLNPEETYQVDSANVYHAIASKKADEWPSVLEQLEGSFALCWYAEGKFHVGRNYGSPLEMSTITELDVSIFTSTEHMAKAACALVGLNSVYPVLVSAGSIKSYSWMDHQMVTRDFKLPSAVTKSTSVTGNSSYYNFHHGRHRHHQTGIWEHAMTQDLRGRKSDHVAAGYARCQDCSTIDDIDKMEQYGLGRYLCDYCFNVAETTTTRVD